MKISTKINLRKIETPERANLLMGKFGKRHCVLSLNGLYFVDQGKGEWVSDINNASIYTYEQLYNRFKDKSKNYVFIIITL